MSADTDFAKHCLELLSCLGPTRAKRMFGGHGLYADGHFVALVAEGVLYLKADAQAQPQFEQAGSQRFSMTFANGRTAGMAYWSAPETALDNPGAMAPWARLALASALRAAAAKPAAKPPTKRSKPPAKPATGTPPQVPASRGVTPAPRRARRR